MQQIGKLVIIVTHSERIAKKSSRVVTISDGCIISDEIKEETKIVKEIQEDLSKEKQNLSFLSSLKLAFKNMKEKKARNLLVSIGASIGIMSVILMLSLGNGVEKYMTETMNGYVNPLVVEVNKKANKEEEKVIKKAPRCCTSFFSRTI